MPKEKEGDEGKFETHRFEKIFITTHSLSLCSLLNETSISFMTWNARLYFSVRRTRNCLCIEFFFI